MATDIDLIAEKQPFLTKTPFLKEGKLKFPQMKQDTIRIKSENRECKCIRHMTRDSPLPL